MQEDSLPSSTTWGPFEVQRRALAVLALLLEHREESTLIEMCRARWASLTSLRRRGAGAGGRGQAAGENDGGDLEGGSGEGSGSSRGLSLRLLLLAQEAVEDCGAWEVVATTAWGTVTMSSTTCGGGVEVRRPHSSQGSWDTWGHPRCTSGGRRGRRGEAAAGRGLWGGQRARVAQEALLLLKAMLLGREDLRELLEACGGCRDNIIAMLLSSKFF